jgi:hypothetical protein
MQKEKKKRKKMHEKEKRHKQPYADLTHRQKREASRKSARFTKDKRFYEMKTFDPLSTFTCL